MALLGHRQSARILILLLVLPAAGVGLAGFIHSRASGGPRYDSAGLPISPVTYHQVIAHPEAHLYYPGATLFHPFGGPQYRDANSSTQNPAFAGGVLASNGKPSQIYPWYRRWLLGHGWRQYRLISADTWQSHQDYARGTRELFTVAMDRRNVLSMTLGQRLPKARTIFEISYTILPYGSKQP